MDSDDLNFILEKAIRRASNLVGYDARPIVRTVAQPIDILGLAIRDLMRRQPDVFFVQIGAHDGISGDPIAPYVRQHRWRGLLIEPQPQVFKQLVRNYQGHDGLIFENVAVDRKDGTLTLHVFAEATAEEHRSMLASTRKHYLTLNGDKEHGTVSEIHVPAMTMNSLLDKHAIDRVDLLQIDTEGYDFEILTALDFTRIQPEIVHFESNFQNRRQRSRLLDLLSGYGYSSLELGQDTLAVRQPQDADATRRLAGSKVVRI